jgi:hypothetical protein
MRPITQFRKHSLILGCLLPLATAYGQVPDPQAMAEVNNLNTQFGVPINQISAPGSYTLTADLALSAASLSGGTPLQANPPVLGTVPAYPADQQDGVFIGVPPYKSQFLSPTQTFRFNYFHDRFDYGGPNTAPTQDYATTYGFDSVNASRDPSTINWWPAGTNFEALLNYPDWDLLMPALGLDVGRYDELVDLGEAPIIRAIINSGKYTPVFLTPAAYNEALIDLENAALDPPTLRQQSWYPSTASAADQAAFEKKYYDGFAMSQYATADAARQLGYKNISIYGWRPVYPRWFGLDTWPANPADDWYWQSVGLQVVSHVDIVNNSDYCFYWTPANVAYVLASNDLTLARIRSLPQEQQIPVRPYFWNQLHGGGGGNRWWRGQGLPTEEMRAIALLNAFTQVDGFSLWNVYGSNPNVSPPVTVGSDVMVRNIILAHQEGSGAPLLAHRYAALHITDVNSITGNVQFQVIDKFGYGDNFGEGPNFPFYDININTLMLHLRAPSEPLSGMFDGLALAKLLEYNLRNDNLVQDFDPQQTFAQQMPILRHVQSGNLHLVATYDPQVIYDMPARPITVPNFGGIAGLNLTFEADSEVRVYIVQTPATGS